MFWIKEKIWVLVNYNFVNKKTMDLQHEILELLLPKSIVSNFDLISVEKIEKKIVLNLEEKFILPTTYPEKEIVSNGFVSPKTIQDFPLRGQVVYLKIKRRRWLVKTTGEKIYREILLEEQGTKFTKEFAAFLKGRN